MAQGERSISLGGDAIRSILITGNGCQVFVGDYDRLRDAYISPQSVFDRVQLDRFIGRIWLTDEVDAFLRGQDRGYFILEAAAGLGKTAFLAHLVKERGYIHLFAEQVRGQEGVAPGLRSLAAQLIVAWDLQPFVADDVLPGDAARPDFLDRLLREAARTRDLHRPGEPIVLVVDGLDEAGTPPGQNVLGLPRVLPKGGLPDRFASPRAGGADHREALAPLLATGRGRPELGRYADVPGAGGLLARHRKRAAGERL
jgi:hypothetical protein